MYNEGRNWTAIVGNYIPYTPVHGNASIKVMKIILIGIAKLFTKRLRYYLGVCHNSVRLLLLDGLYCDSYN